MYKADLFFRLKALNFFLFKATLVLSLACLHGYGQNDLPFRVNAFNPEIEINCKSDSTLIGITVDDWIPGIQYLWNTGQTDSIIFVHPTISTTYSISVSHPSYNYVEVKTFTVNVNNSPIYVNNELEIIPNSICPGLDVELEVHPSGGIGTYTFSWNNGNSENPTSVESATSGIYTVTITDECNTSAVTYVFLLIEPQNPLITPDQIKLDFLCENQPFEIAPNMSNVAGGIGYGYKFSFQPQSFTNIPLTVMPKDEAIYQVFITDACQTQVNNVEIVLNKIDPFIPNLTEEIICSGDLVQLEKFDSIGNILYWQNDQLSQELIQTFEKSTDIEVLFIDECGEQHTLTKKILIDDANSNFDYQVKIASNSVNLLAEDAQSKSFLWEVNNEKVSTSFEFLAHLNIGYNTVKLTTTSETGCISSTTRQIILRDGIDVPTAFSPNGDGINDIFTIHFDEELIDFDIEIFNRWGQLIFKSSDQYFEWDGITGNPNGQLNTFAYKLKGLSKEGTNFIKNGTITLIRN